MFCGKCGTKINDGDSFCTNCGAIVNLEDIKTENTKNCDLTSQINKTKCVSDYNEDTCVNVMDTIKFGMYPQNDISGSRKEAIEWLVLEKDDLNHRALLTTKYILDSKYFNKGEIFGNSWNTTNSLRLWLNNHFINTAFNALDKNIILNFNDFQRNFNASDEEFSSKVFLLTKEEIKKYFGEENIHQYNKKAACKGTAYSKRIRIYI